MMKEYLNNKKETDNLIFNDGKMRWIKTGDLGYLDEDELGQSKKVLIAAALTYVAALFTAIAQLIRLVAISNRRN